jgi:4-amino-4-deoxy-L-arabinose transferase-like glycosyltransferase
MSVVSVERPSQSASVRDQSTLHPRFWRVALILSALFLVLHLSYAPLFNPDEGRYASASLEMEQGFEGRAPDWVVPYLNTVPRLNKPPLVYWVAGAFMRVLGPTETSARLASAMAALGVMALVWHLGNVMFGRRVALLGALVWATATFPFGLARVLNTDMLLCFSITLGLVGIWHALENGRWTSEDGPDPRARVHWRPVLVAGIGMGLALLSKGPVGVALPLLIGFIYLFARNWQGLSAPTTFLSRTGRDLWRDKVLWLSLLPALCIALAMALPWVMAISQRIPHFLENFLLNENLGRFSGSQEYHDPTPFWYYVPVVLLGLLPWPMFLLWSGPQRAEVVRDETQAAFEARARWFLWLWALIPVVAFSFSSTKLVTYILPSFPAFCLLLGQACSRAFKSQSDASTPTIPVSPRLWWSAIGGTALLNILIAVGLTTYLTSDKTLPRSEGLLLSALLLLVLVGGSLVLLGVARQQRGERVFAVVWLIAMSLHALVLYGAGRVALYEDASPIVRAIAPHMAPSDRLVLYKTFQPAAIFYMQRPVEIVDFTNNSGLEETTLRQSKYFPPHDDQLLDRLQRSSQRVYVLLKWGDNMPQQFPQGFHLVAASNDYYLISNRPAPAGFRYEFIAPRKRERFEVVRRLVGQ